MGILITLTQKSALASSVSESLLQYFFNCIFEANWLLAPAQGLWSSTRTKDRGLMPVCNCPPACTKSRFNDISLLVLCSSVVVVMQYCSSVVGVVVHILLLGGRLLGAALLMLGGGGGSFIAWPLVSLLLRAAGTILVENSRSSSGAQCNGRKEKNGHEDKRDELLICIRTIYQWEFNSGSSWSSAQLCSDDLPMDCNGFPCDSVTTRVTIIAQRVIWFFGIECNVKWRPVLESIVTN